MDTHGLVAMVCQSCGGSLQPHDIDEPKEQGGFTEEYRCVNCGASRFISGQEDEDPSNWRQWGAA